MVDYQPSDRALPRMAVAIIGLAGLLLMLSLLKPFMSMLHATYAPYVQTSLIGFYMTAIAPWLFKILSLARK